MGFSFSSGLFEVCFGLVFVLFFVMFFITIVRGIRQWNSNNHSPQLTVDAMVVTKRTAVSHHHQNTGTGSMGGYSTQYHVTFQVESGDRMEFNVNGSEYGMLAEGDRGRLRFQGTRYLGFERQLYQQ